MGNARSSKMRECDGGSRKKALRHGAPDARELIPRICDAYPLPRQHKIERRDPSRFCLPNLNQQVTLEQRIAVVAFLTGKVQLGGQYRTMGRLKPNVVVPCSSRIQTRQHRL